MKRDIRIIVADPAGNITIFVLDQFDRSDYPGIAAQLLEHKELKGEQVAFIKSDDAMEMCGLEFCGNASRTFALISARRKNICGCRSIDIKTSGVKEKLSVAINTANNYTKLKMPSPENIIRLENTGSDLLDQRQYISFDGIGHLILKDVTPSDQLFTEIREYISKTFDPPAIGAMFYDTRSNHLTPIVYVSDVDTTYWEGSCGSGSTALAIALSEGCRDGICTYSFTQPAGSIIASVERVKGAASSVYIEGPVEISEVMTVSIDV